MTLRVVLGLWSTGLILGILFSVWLWLAIAANTFRTVMGKLMICLLMLGLLCNWVLLYRVPEIVTRGRFPDGGESDSTWRTQEARHVGSDTIASGF